MPTTAPIDYDAFRREVDTFARTRCPPALRERVRANAKLHREDYAAWQRILHAHGWAAPGWPTSVGGTGWDLRQRYLFEEVMAERDCPPQFHHGLGHIGPVLLHFGTPEQHARFVPGILDGSVWWCQGYSEPGAGSDLASLKTRAVRDGDVYVVDGTKIWTTHAHHANMMFALVRTGTDSARKQDGISFLLIDMRSPGVTVRPIVGIHGWHLFNQVFLDGVEVPIEQRVGEENQGWTIAKSLLEFERLSLARVAENRRRLAKVRAIGEQVREAGAPLAERPWFRRRFAELEVRLEALAATVLRFRVQAEAGRRLGPETGMLKLVGSQLIQDVETLAVDALGPQTLAWDRDAHFDLPAPGSPSPLVERHPYAPTASSRRFVTRGFTIAGGSSEIQHEVLAKQVL
ncbi:MAG TPA: acyl-CoA dehydrogenase family protein, partial [Burkholderiaceae bacterium]|nr:acyl-CoA dehydrogenase family protein [Burkholderiaceae bacterium]